MQQARPRAAFEKAVRAGAQQERALQRRDGAVDRPHRGEWPVIIALARARATVLEDLRRPVIRSDDDVGKRLIVAQQHVEPRPQSFDQVGFEEERFGLGRGGDELHRRGRRDHPFDARVVPRRAGVGRDPLLDVLRLADVEHLAGRIEHAIDAGRRRRELGVGSTSPRGRPRSGWSLRQCRAPALRCRAAPAPRRPRRARSPDQCLCRDRPCRDRGFVTAMRIARMVNNSHRGLRKYTVP